MENFRKKFDQKMINYGFISEDYLYLLDDLFKDDCAFYYYFLYDVIGEEIECNMPIKELRKIYRRFNEIAIIRSKGKL